MLRVLLAEAELELVPTEIAGHPAVRASAKAQDKRPGQVLLDQNLHGAALGKLEEGARRGRPDIVHYCLLTLLESPLAKAGQVEVAIHTRQRLLIRVKPDTRLPRGEARFQGLMGKVLREGRSQDKKPLIWVEGELTPAQALHAFAKGPVLRLDEGGTLLSPADLAARADAAGDLTLVLGAFPSGQFLPEWVAAAPEAVAVWKEPLNAWAVAAEAVAGYRARWGPALAPGTPAPA
ncbi:MAG: rRNA small subunit pseudouridine methyltransferase Nep1 [Thermoplasmata archaeon]|nr:rRNA small subunit pseudouridine methyltransferase Nep1 [Thermoplasmata archaeon]